MPSDSPKMLSGMLVYPYDSIKTLSETLLKPYDSTKTLSETLVKHFNSTKMFIFVKETLHPASKCSLLLRKRCIQEQNVSFC